MDNRIKGELPSGIIKNPQLKPAACDFSVNDAIMLIEDVAYPVYHEEIEICGFAAANAKRGGKVLIAAREA